MMGIKEDQLQWYIIFFDKKSSGCGRPSSSALLIVNNDTKQNLQLAEELHKAIIKKNFKKKSLFWI